MKSENSCIHRMKIYLFMQEFFEIYSRLSAVNSHYICPSLYRLISFWIFAVGVSAFSRDTLWFRELMIAAINLLISASTYQSRLRSSGVW